MQLRFGPLDVEVWIKEKGTNEPFEKADMIKTFDMENIPGFDFSKKWNKKKDRSLHRMVSESPTRGPPPSMQAANMAGTKKARKYKSYKSGNVALTNM